MVGYRTRNKTKKSVVEGRGVKKIRKSSTLSYSRGGGLSGNETTTTGKAARKSRGSEGRKKVVSRGCNKSINTEKREVEKSQPHPVIKKEEQHLPSQPSHADGAELFQHPELKLEQQSELKKQVDGALPLFVEPHFLWRGGKESAVRGGKAKTQECILRLIVESQYVVPCKRKRRCRANAPSILKPTPALLEDDLAGKINSVAVFKAKRNGGIGGSISPYRLQLPGAKENLNPSKIRTILSLCSGIRGQDRGMAAALAQYQVHWFCVDIDRSGAASAAAKAEGFVVINQIPTDRRKLLKLLAQKDRNVYFRTSMKEFQTAMDAHAPRSWQILAPNALVGGTPCQLYSMVSQELWHVSKKRGESKGIGVWKPLPNEELEEFISIAFACRKYVDMIMHENVSGFLKGRPHILVSADLELDGVDMAFRNVEFQRKNVSSTTLMNVLSTRPLHWLLYAMVCRLDMSVQSFLLTADALGAPEHKANVLTVCVRRGLWLPRLPIAQHHVYRPFSGGGTHGLAMHTVISAGDGAPPATSVFENLDRLLATLEGTWSAYAKLSIFHRYSRFVWFSKGLHTDAFELEIKSLVLAGLLETSISEWGIAYAKEFADDLSTPGTPERRRRCRAYRRTSNPHRAIVRNLFTLACRNAEKQWHTSEVLSLSAGNNGCDENAGNNSSVHGLQLNWTNTKWSSQRKAEELVAYEAVTSFRDPAQNLLYDGDGTRLCHWCSLKGFPPNAVIYTPYQSMDTCNQLLRDSFNCHSSVVLFREIFGLPQLGQEQGAGEKCVLESSLECE